MDTELLLFLHLLGAFLLIGGSITAAVLRLAAIGRPRPSEAVVLLRAVRPVVPLVGGGFVLTLAAGFWLVEEVGYDYGASWLSWTFALVAYLLVVGAFAGRMDRKTREFAERVAADGDHPTPELDASLRNPLALGLNVSMLVATLVIVALMVWKPA